MSYISNYIDSLKFQDLRESVNNTSSSFVEKIDNNFEAGHEMTCLLLGNVQSGKTGQMLGIISRLADKGFSIFLLLTTDNVDLQRQTFNRVKDALPSFNVYSKEDTTRFSQDNLIKPIVIVLNKNGRILNKWKNLLLNHNTCHGLPLVILDDEGDAASLNTMVNRRRQSTINRSLQAIKNTAQGGTIYIEVTATPQAIILQSELSNWRPCFIQYFKPGNGYLGGDFFYSNPRSYCIRFTAENELPEATSDDDIPTPAGLRDSILSFLINCAHKKLKGETNCNFMIHPSHRINVHTAFVDRVNEHLNLLVNSLQDDDFKAVLHESWSDLQRTRPDLEPFEDILEVVQEILEEEELQTIPLNSNSFVCRDSNDPNALNLGKGFNIVVGGNTLGRGITFPHLQTVYYCRSSRAPQADTFWQHSRIFGYDREADLVRIFIPPTIHSQFVAMNESNNLLIKQVEQGLDKIQIIYPNNIKPTRKNVLDTTRVNIISGGMNMFPISPIENNTQSIDPLILDYATEESVDVSGELILQLLELAGSNNPDDFNNERFISSIKSLAGKRPTMKYKLIVRLNRNISRGTGTLLSENDRQIGDKFADEVVLTMYRVNGHMAQGWKGSPLWIPNIKFPQNTCFYYAD